LHEIRNHFFVEMDYHIFYNAYLCLGAGYTICPIKTVFDIGLLNLVGAIGLKIKELINDHV